jgi:hypothetical protein
MRYGGEKRAPKFPTDSSALSQGDVASRPSVVLFAFAAMVVAACSSEIPHHYQNEGKLCVYPAGVYGDPASAAAQSYAYAADSSFNVVVAFKGCLSSSCSRDIVTSCSVAETGGQLQVTSEGSYVELEKDTCTTDCMRFAATCTTPALSAGSQVFHHGADTLVLTLPSAGPPSCIGQIKEF